MGDHPNHNQRRKVSPEELETVLTAHHEWLQTGGQKGTFGNLMGAELRGVNLKGADLQEVNLEDAVLDQAELSYANLEDAYCVNTSFKQARLGGTNLQATIVSAQFQNASLNGAKLKDAVCLSANFQGADLRNADFRQAILKESSFQEAQLDNADLRDSDLSDADLTKAKGIMIGTLAGASLTNAKLTQAIESFEGLAHVAEASQNARKIFFGMLLGCAYAWLTIATTTDVRLLTNSSSSPLPIIGTEIPIAWFYWAAPLVLLSVYFYLHLYMQRLWQGLATLPAIFPDGKPLDERAYPWLLNGLVRAHFLHLKRRHRALSRLENAVSIFLAWWVVPLTLAGFWLRYLPRQDWAGTLLLLASLFVALDFGIRSYQIALATLCQAERQEDQDRYSPMEDQPSWKVALQFMRTYRPRAAAIYISMGIFLLSLGSIEGARPSLNRTVELWVPATWAPSLFALVGYDPFADLREQEVSTKSPNWTGLSERPTTELQGQRDLQEKAKAELAQVKGAKLGHASLRHAIAVRAFLVKADLRSADLRHANLWLANVQEAILVRASLQLAILMKANLQNAILIGAKLQQANLDEANLQNANLQKAKLQKANLQKANLQKANLQGADLQEAGLRDANLQETDLRHAIFWPKDLEEAKLPDAQERACRQLRRARNWETAYRDETMACGAPVTELLPPPSVN